MDTNVVKNLIRIGRVSTVNGAAATCTVTFTDKDAVVSADLPVLQHGTRHNKSYWLPDIDSLVVCVFLPNTSGHGINDGIILGCIYSDVDAVPQSDPSVKMIQTADGSTFTFDGGALKIDLTGEFTINASKINIQES